MLAVVILPPSPRRSRKNDLNPETEVGRKELTYKHMTYYCVNLSIATTRLVVTLGVKRAAPRDNKTKGRKREKQKFESI